MAEGMVLDPAGAYASTRMPGRRSWLAGPSRVLSDPDDDDLFPHGTSDISGVVYPPEGELFGRARRQMAGAMAGRSCQLQSGGGLHDLWRDGHGDHLSKGVRRQPLVAVDVSVLLVIDIGGLLARCPSAFYLSSYMGKNRTWPEQARNTGPENQRKCFDSFRPCA